MESASLEGVCERLKQEVAAELVTGPGKRWRCPTGLRSRIVSYARVCRERGGPSFARAAIAAQLGDRNEAIRLLQQAITRGFSGYRQIHVDINFDPVRNDPEFQEIVRPKG